MPESSDCKWYNCRFIQKEVISGSLNSTRMIPIVTCTHPNGKGKIIGKCDDTNECSRFEKEDNDVDNGNQ